MKHILILFTFFIILPEQSFSQINTCKSELKGQELVISNNLVSFTYQWNNGNIMLKGYQLKGAGYLQSQQTVEDLKLFSDNLVAEEPVIRSSPKKRFAGEEEFLEVSIQFKLGGLEINRILEIFPQSPAISSYYKVKGNPQQSWINVVEKQIGTELIEDQSLLSKKAQHQSLGCVPLPGKHWQAKAVSFQDATDHHNTLVFEKDYLPYSKPEEIQANILLLKNTGNNTGIFILKESPLGHQQQSYPGSDFSLSLSKVEISGTGLVKSHLDEQQWQRSYGYVIGLSTADETAQLLALRTYQKTIRSLKPNRDEMIMSNTWGDRNKDSRMNEAFILSELEAAAKLGITHFQLDDGWQQGLSANSAKKEGKKWDSWSLEDWQPNAQRFPNGFKAIADRARLLNIQLGLWFNPGSNNDYETWNRDAEILADYYRKYQIKAFKIDGVELKSKKAEENLRNFFDKVIALTEGNIIFNLDVTAGRRGGYHYFNEYGNIFLENRYTDWGNYYPHTTLRNLWMLSKYVPAEKLQIEWLNHWRNVDKYSTDDFLAPSKISWDYIAATTLMAQPLAWMEVSSLPNEAFKHANLLKNYKELQHEIHQGAILPIGNVPNGFSWTGFQSIKEKEGFFMIFREKSSHKKMMLKTHLKPQQKIKLMPVLTDQTPLIIKVNNLSEIEFALENEFSFALYKYEILNN